MGTYDADMLPDEGHSKFAGPLISLCGLESAHARQSSSKLDAALAN